MQTPPPHTKNAPTRTPSPAPAPRQPVFDILRGIGIAEVMTHHLLSYAQRKYYESDTAAFLALFWTNRVLHFAVATFLFASAFLLSRSLLRRSNPDWKRYFGRRAQMTLWPYILWSVIYVAFRLLKVEVGSDVEPIVVSLPLIGDLTLPALLAKPAEWRDNILWGKSYYHLYFLSILLQFSLLLPLLVLLVRRVKLRFWAVVALAAAAQGAVYALQSALRFPYPASLVFWYLPPTLLGVWFGANEEEGKAVLHRRLPALLLSTALGFAVYIFLTWQVRQKIPIYSGLYNSAATLYTTGMALCLLLFSQWLAAHRERFAQNIATVFVKLGERSLPLFLVHPLILYFLGGPKITQVVKGLPLAPLWVGIALFALTWGFASLVRRLHLDTLLFGRAVPPSKTAAPAPGLASQSDAV